MDENKRELVEISINHQGIDVTAVVSLEEANVLLNDEAAASKYAEALLAQDLEAQVSQEKDVLLVEEHTSAEDIQRSKQSDSNTFSTKEATLLFQRLRADYNEKFNDRKTLKQGLWQKIAEAMKKNGIQIQEGREGAEKCRQKFANLQRSYLNYIKHMKTTGEERKDPPPYFDEMNAILGNKDKVNPPYLEDSLDTSNYDMDEPTASCSNASSLASSEHSSNSSGVTTKPKEIKNRFSSSHTTSIRPTTNFNKVVELFKEQHDQLRQDKAQHMKVFEDAIRVQNAQRGQFLKFLKKAVKRKRGHDSSSSSSDE